MGDDQDLVELATRLFGMARTGNTGELDAYVEAGVPVNLANESGDTLLMLAAYHGHPETVRALLDRGADPDKLNDRGQSPLAGAVFKGENDVVRVLAEGGADPDAGAPTARQSAEMFGKQELLALFDR
ncbi:ankyrin repeat domain-containing protein [Sciscionella marina]|uniref:ankyrin repeat domain-containing protein n=1 Tax=Sciscionella marina TaxID=508770 RepID=UPI00036BCC53|nr:ankyrin repeat domain-containing protein [Sciscionella marina]